MMNVNEQLYMEVKGKWNSLYPVYFDSAKSLAEGRKLPKGLCIDTPTLQELAQAVSQCQLRNIIEPHKMYSRDHLLMGRLKVELLKENGQPMKPGVTNKKKMMVAVAGRLRAMRDK